MSNIDRAFDLLQEAKGHESKGKLFQAAASYSEARDILDDLAAANNNNKNNNDADPEAAKIHELYREKAIEYLHHARTCLLNAMKKEKEYDEQKNRATSTSAVSCAKLSDEDAKVRTDVFNALFSKKTAPKQLSTSDIETRLLELNASLPKGFKTSDERMKDINRGLNRLGLSSINTNSQPKLVEPDIVPKSEEEQIAEIMAQAKDEIAVAPVEIATNKSEDNAVPDTFDDVSSCTSEDSDIVDRKTLMGDNCDEVIAVLTIRKRIAKAQVQLAETMALLDEAKTALDREEEEAELRDIDDSEKGSGAHLGMGKKKLRHAQKDLHRALTEWKENFP